MKKLLTALLSILMVFALVGCNSTEDTSIVQEPKKQEEVIEETKEEPEIVGGFVDAQDKTITEELKEIFNSALDGLMGASYEPVELVATQVVNGINYKFLAKGTKTTNPITKGSYYITIYKDLQGNVELKDIEVIEEKQEEVKTQDVTQMSFWVVFYDQYGNELQREALKYGTVPEYKLWIPEGFDNWIDKKTQEVVDSFKAITGNTYYQAVCHEVIHEDDEEDYSSNDSSESNPDGDFVKYLYWDGTQLVVKETSDYTEITNSTTTLSSGFYVVKDNVSTGALFVEGTDSAPTYLILCDGAILTSTCTSGNNAAITVNNGNTLIITTPQNGTGELKAYGDEEAAAIGSDGYKAAGHITINGGKIYAEAKEYGAGIGSGECGASGVITINGGDITAIGNSGGAGIGAGGSQSADTIIINGGNINATAGMNGAGIGGGSSGGNGGTITINGGTIKADAGSGLGSGIGYGDSGSTATVLFNGGTITVIGGDGSITNGGPGIGGTTTVNGGTTTITGGTMMPGINGATTINGGTITVTAGNTASGINGETKITGGTTTVTGGNNAAGINGNTTITGGTTTITAGNTKAAIVGTISINTFDGKIFAGDNKDSASELQNNQIDDFVTTHNQRYVKFEQNECLAEGTLINMADGSKKAVEQIELGDRVLAFNHYLGKVEETTVAANFEYLEKKVDGFTLIFDNGSKINVSGGHCFFEKEANKYIPITIDNYGDYLGSYFYNAIDDSWIKLVNVELINRPVRTFVLGTYKDINVVADDMLCNEDGEYLAFVNVFDFEDDLSYDETDIQESIEKYGLWNLEEQDYITQEMIDAGLDYLYDAYNLKYFNIMESKGLLGNRSIKEIVVSNFENADEFVD